jgi:hypothetical protein
MPDAARWKEMGSTLRQSAERRRDPLARQTLLTLAADCEAIAAHIRSAAQQPGKPKPPGNPPAPAPEPPGGEHSPPVEEPPRPIPVPPIEPPARWARRGK